jgi:hypothetical protein
MNLYLINNPMIQNEIVIQMEFSLLKRTSILRIIHLYLLAIIQLEMFRIISEVDKDI